MNTLDNQYQPNGSALHAADDAQHVARVRQYITSKEFQPGDKLPAERQLIVELGMTRGALRRAFDALEHEGLIWRHVGKGTFISHDGADTADSIDWTRGIARQITPLKMVRARLCIEPALAGEAALNASAESLMRMREALRKASAAASWEEYEVQDDNFHREIARASDNLLLLGLFDQLNRVRRAVAFDAVTRETQRPSAEHTSFAEHEKIAQAIEARDRTNAQEAMRTHLHSVSKRLFEER